MFFDQGLCFFFYINSLYKIVFSIYIYLQLLLILLFNILVEIIYCKFECFLVGDIKI